jgi:hypothetical protein
MKNSTVVALIAGAIVAGLGVAVVLPDSDDGPNQQRTPREAACRMLGEGDSATRAFDVLVDLDIPELAASRAVNEAIADGCVR